MLEKTITVVDFVILSPTVFKHCPFKCTKIIKNIANVRIVQNIYSAQIRYI